MNEEVHILDVELNKCIPSYPKCSDETFVATIRLFYLLYNRQVQLDDFKSVSKEDPSPKSYVYGPLIGKAVKRKTAQDTLITDFIVNVLKLPFDSALTNNTQAVIASLPPTEPNPVRHVIFIEWTFWDRENFVRLRRDFWRGTSAVPRSNFVCVGKRGKDDAVVCSHVLIDPSLPMEQRRENEIKRHMQMCLEKPLPNEEAGLVPLVVDTTLATHSWREMPKDFPRERVPLERWKAEHPYFSKCTYTARNIIPLKHEERSKLSPQHNAWYTAMENGTISAEDVQDFAAFLSHKISRFAQCYVQFGYDPFPFLLHQSLTLPEYLKMFVDPPPPRVLVTASSSPSALVIVSQAFQDSAGLMARLMKFLTNKKSGKGKVTLLVIDVSNADIAGFVASFKDFAWRRAGDAHVFLEDERSAFHFLTRVCDGWQYPFEAIIDFEPLLCDKSHPLFAFLPFAVATNPGSAPASTTKRR